MPSDGLIGEGLRNVPGLIALFDRELEGGGEVACWSFIFFTSLFGFFFLNHDNIIIIYYCCDGCWNGLGTQVLLR